MNGVPFTRFQEEILEANWLKMPASELAEILGRPASCLYQKAVRMKLARKNNPPYGPEIFDAIKTLHAEGLLDTDIAARINARGGRQVDRRHIAEIRKFKLKLPVNEKARLERRRQAVRTQFERLGIPGRPWLRAIAFRKFALENGWPEDLRPREVQIMNVLIEHGPQTRMQLAKLIGMSTHRIAKNKVPVLLAGNGPGGLYTASLMQRGFVARQYRGGGPGAGSGRSTNLYFATPLAIEWREQHDDRKRQANGSAESH